MREDQISNAVAFLVHPKVDADLCRKAALEVDRFREVKTGCGGKVRDSGEESKRAFLTQKGLTAPEIDEAFVRAGEQGGGAGEGVEYGQEVADGKPQYSSWGKVHDDSGDVF